MRQSGVDSFCLIPFRMLFGTFEAREAVENATYEGEDAPPRADWLETFINFGITMEQLCEHLEAARLNDHLNNSMLVHKLIDKLLDRVRYKRRRVDSAQRMLTNFTTDIVSDVSEVAEFTTLSMNDRCSLEIRTIGRRSLYMSTSPCVGQICPEHRGY